MIDLNGVKMLVKIRMPALKQLELKNCGLKDESIKYLIKGKWPKLKILALGINNIIYMVIILILGEWIM